MNPLFKKEIRLLLPSFLAVLALEVLLPWFHENIHDIVFFYTPIVMFLGMIVLAIDPFGREFSLLTFPSLISQPVERQQLWRVKIMALFLASVLIFVAYYFSCALRVHEAITNVHSIWHVKPGTISSDFHHAMIASVALLLVAAAGGLWTSLLFRQTAAAFWITLLTPVGLLFLIGYVMLRFFHSASDFVVYSVLYGAAGIYSLAGFWLAHRLFRRAQDAAWLGGVINVSAWRYFEIGKRRDVGVRRRQPVAALLKKEFQLHSISLICAGVVLVLHIAALIVRASYGNFHKNSLIYGLTTIFWIFWLIIPLILGSTAVAEERKLCVADTQFCLPAARRKQFAIKFIPVLILGALLGGVMPVLMEGIAGSLGAPNELFQALARNYNNNYSVYGPGLPLASISVIALSTGLVCLGFFASTLARNFLQALGIAIVILVGCCLLVFSNALPMILHFTIFGITLWRSFLPLLLAVPVVPIAFLWLAWLNFSHYRDGWRLWRRNVLGLVGTLAFVAVSSTLIYNRVWEVFEPAEPSHGPAVFSPVNRPVLSSEASTGWELEVRLPDGRIWFDTLSYPLEHRDNLWLRIWYAFTHPLPVSAGPTQFMAGSNWVSATTARVQFWNPPDVSPRQVIGYLDTVGIKAAGTLWISHEAKPFVWTGAKMVRYGDETNWRQVIYFGYRLLLLKNNGTLWQWGTNSLSWDHWQTNWPTVRKYPLQQFGTNSDWQDIFSRPSYVLARDKKGRVWNIDLNEKAKRETNLDQIVSHTFSGTISGPNAYIGTNGALWANDRYWKQGRMIGTGRFFRTGKATNWVAVTVSWTRMVALKSDGSLWQWRWKYGQESAREAATNAPIRLGIHNDWVGLTSTWNGPVTLAADGSLWLWPDHSIFPLLKLPKQPEFLGNVFGKGY